MERKELLVCSVPEVVPQRRRYSTDWVLPTAAAAALDDWTTLTHGRSQSGRWRAMERTAICACANASASASEEGERSESDNALTVAVDERSLRKHPPWGAFWQRYGKSIRRPSRWHTCYLAALTLRMQSQSRTQERTRLSKHCLAVRE